MKKILFFAFAFMAIQSNIFTEEQSLDNLDRTAIDILDPVKRDEGHPVRALVLFGGAFCEPRIYHDLAREIQKTVHNLYVILPKCMFNMCFELQIGLLMKKVFRTIDDLPTKVEEIFLSGHSLSGSSLGSFIMKCKETQRRTKGVILMGSYLSRFYYEKRMNFGIPILTITGDMDGGSAKPVKMAEDLFWAMKRSDEYACNMNPLIIVEGVSHLQFTNGDVPDKIKKVDLKPELSYEDAHEKIGYFVAHFLLSHTGKDDKDSKFADIRKDSQKIISDEMMGKTLDYLSPILDSFEYEGSPLLTYNTSPLVEKLQRELTQLSDKDFDDQFEVVSESMSLFDMFKKSAKPFFKLHKRKVRVTSYSGLRMSLQDIFMDYSDYKTPYETLIKLKSKESFSEFIDDKSKDKPIDYMNACRVIQEDIISWAFDKLPERVKTRLEKDQQKLVIYDPVRQRDGYLWMLTPMLVEDKKELGFYITPRYVLTETNLKPEKIAGMFYCKVWGPSKIMEWFYTDSLKFNRRLLD